MRKVSKFDVGDLLPIGLTLVVFGIAIAYGLNVLGDIGEDLCDGTLEHYNTGTCWTCPNATHNSFNATDQLCYNASIEDSGSAIQAGDSDFNATSDAISGVAKFPDKMPLIATVVIAAVIIGILVRYLYVKFA